MQEIFFQDLLKKTGCLIAGLFFVLSAILLPLSSAAQIDAPEGVPPISEQRPEGYAEAQEYGPQSLINILGQIRNFLLIAGILFVVVALIVSGISYTQAKGSGDQEKLKAAKKRLYWALIGVVVILAIYVLISTLRNIISSQSLV